MLTQLDFTVNSVDLQKSQLVNALAHARTHTHTDADFFILPVALSSLEQLGSGVQCSRAPGFGGVGGHS